MDIGGLLHVLDSLVAHSCMLFSDTFSVFVFFIADLVVDTHPAGFLVHADVLLHPLVVVHLLEHTLEGIASWSSDLCSHLVVLRRVSLSVVVAVELALDLRLDGVDWVP